MKKIVWAVACAMALAAPAFLCACADGGKDNKLVIITTNDTHSNIDPGRDGLGGVMRRKALIDSIRGAEDNVLVIDAGDAVQGSLYFYLYGGKVEQEVLNMLGTDMRILGNHEFDNGVDSLAAVLKLSDATKLSSNYILDNSALKGMFKPCEIKEINGHKIGFIGINLNPDGIVAKGNYDGVEFLPIVATANEMARKLREEDKVEAVIAVSHIGYNPAGLVGDSVLAVNSRGIDVIIGGHSHDTIDPTTTEGLRRSHLLNLDGKPVLVTQTGKYGRNVGKIEIDLDSLALGATPRYELLPVDTRYDGYPDPAMAKMLSGYSAGVDSLMHDWIGTTDRLLKNSDPELLNFFCDYVLERGHELTGTVDLAIANKGGLRADIPEGNFSKGHIINMVPFRNYVCVVEMSGKDLADVFDVMAMTDGNGVSDNVRVKYMKNGDKPEVKEILIDGKKLDPARTYRVATIDYLANGGDYMTGFTRGKVVAQSPNAVFDDLIYYFTDGKGKGHKLKSSAENRWTAVASGE